MSAIAIAPHYSSHTSIGRRGTRRGPQRALDAQRNRYQCEALEPRLLLSVYTINGTAGNDTIGLSTRIHFVPPGVYVDDVNWAITNGATGGIAVTPGSDSILLDTGTGQDTVSVLGTFTNVPTTITGHSTSAGPDDTLTIGNAGSIQGIFGSIYANNPSGMWNITVDDSADGTSRSASVDNSMGIGSITGLGPAPISWNDVDTRSVTIKTGPGGDAINVLNTAVPVNIRGASTVNLGNYSIGAQGILSTVNIEGSQSPSTILIDDSPNTSNLFHTATLRTLRTNPDDSDGNADTWGQVSGLAPGNINYEYGDTASITLNLGRLDNTVNVLDTGTATSVFGSLLSSAYVDTMNVLAVAGGTTLNIDGQSSSDHVNITNAGSVQGILGTINVESHNQLNRLLIDDSADAVGRTATLNNIGTNPSDSQGNTDPWNQVSGLAPGTINWETFDNIEFTINLGTGNDTFDLTGGTSFGLMTLNIGPGDDSIIADYRAGTISGFVTLDGGTGSNTLTIIAGTGDIIPVTSTTITHGTENLSYSNIQTLELDAGLFVIIGNLYFLNLSAQGAGTLVNLQTSQDLGSLVVGDGAKVTLAASSVPLAKEVFCTSVSILGTGQLDLTNNQLSLSTFAADPIATVRAYLASSYNGGAWNGNGIVTSSADVHHGLGFGDHAFGGTGHNIVIRWTRYGDVNLDGSVNFSDILILAQHYGQTSGNWDQGDFNYDSTVNFSDVLALVQNYGAAASVAQPAASVSMASAAVALVSPTNRRRPQVGNSNLRLHH